MPATRHAAMLTISIKPELAATIRAQAQEERRTISAIVCMAVEAYLHRANDKPAPQRKRLVRPT